MPDMGCAFHVARGTRIPALLSLVLCTLGLQAAAAEGFGAEGPTAACHLPKLFKSALSVNVF